MIRNAVRAALALAIFVPSQALACGMYIPSDANLIASMGEIDRAEKTASIDVTALFAEMQIEVVDPRLVPAEKDLFIAAIKGEVPELKQVASLDEVASDMVALADAVPER